MSVEQIKEEIAHCDYCIQRIQQNMIGELLASYGGRTTGHSSDNVFLQEYIERKEALNKKLNKLTHQHKENSMNKEYAWVIQRDDGMYVSRDDGEQCYFNNSLIYARRFENKRIVEFKILQRELQTASQLK